MKYRNIYWFLLDGLSPKFLNSCGAKECEANFIDELISRGTCFCQVYSANGGTHSSMHVFFSGLYSFVNGVMGWPLESMRRFDPEIFTITDFFKEAGYNTYRYCDADGERTVPMSGFDYWESSGYKIGQILNNTDFCDCVRRKSFIQKVNNDTANKFVYHHIELLHDLNGQLGLFWSSQDYAKNIKTLSKYFKKLFEEYRINDDDLIIISSDHGVLLDENYKETEAKYGLRQKEISSVCFWSIIGKGLPQKVCNKLISAIDIPSTLVELVLEKDFPGQGVSQLGYVWDENLYIKKPVFREKGSYFTTPQFWDKSVCWTVRDDNYKYVFSDRDKSEWLIDLNDGDYVENIADKFPDLLKKYRKLVKYEMIDNNTRALDVYRKCGFTKRKKDIKPVISVILKMTKFNKTLLDNLLDLAGPYYELVIVASQKLKLQLLYLQNHPRVVLVENGRNYLSLCSGEYLFFASEKYYYDERILSELSFIMKEKPNFSVLKVSKQIKMIRNKNFQDYDISHLITPMKGKSFFHTEKTGNRRIIHMGPVKISYKCPKISNCEGVQNE